MKKLILSLVFLAAMQNYLFAEKINVHAMKGQWVFDSPGDEDMCCENSMAGTCYFITVGPGVDYVVNGDIDDNMEITISPNCIAKMKVTIINRAGLNLEVVETRRFTQTKNASGTFSIAY